MTGPIRLACMYCDRSDCDGVYEIPADWLDVDALEDFQIHAHTASEWWTHLGTCPDCDAVGCGR